jgi:hypothetical protein
MWLASMMLSTRRYLTGTLLEHQVSRALRRRSWRQGSARLCLKRCLMSSPFLLFRLLLAEIEVEAAGFSPGRANGGMIVSDTSVAGSACRATSCASMSTCTGQRDDVYGSKETATRHQVSRATAAQSRAIVASCDDHVASATVSRNETVSFDVTRTVAKVTVRLPVFC